MSYIGTLHLLGAKSNWKCDLAFEDLPMSSKDLDIDWFEVPPHSLTYEQATELVNKAEPEEKVLGQLRYHFGLHVDELKSGKMSDLTLLDNFFAMFSQAFFFRLLRRETCELKFVPIGTQEWSIKQIERGRWGSAHRQKFEKAGIKSRIEVLERDIEDIESRALAHLGTLAHEMVHAHSHINACHCEERYRALKPENRGMTGHGLSWQRCAMMVERSLKKAFGGRITLNRRKAAGKELAFRGTTADSFPLAELELKVADVERAIERSTTRDGDDISRTKECVERRIKKHTKKRKRTSSQSNLEEDI